jgi:hypothetical protein
VLLAQVRSLAQVIASGHLLQAIPGDHKARGVAYNVIRAER